MLVLIVFLCLLLLIAVPFILIRLVSPCLDSQQYGNCLLVIAHPDDECMFFAPILLALQSNTYVLCLSNGHNHRADELRRSCSRLRVKDHKIVHDQLNLRDDQTVSWSADAVLGHVRQAIRQWDISTLVSFDENGVSYHRNHSSIYHALLRLPRTSQLHFLALQSLPIYRKYSILIDLLLSRFSSQSKTMKRFVLPVNDSLTPYRAMSEHRSQLAWFRYLYLLFSRYIWFNDFRQIY